MAKPASVYDIPRLCQSMIVDLRALERARRQRLDAVRHYLGSYSPAEGTQLPNPINLLARYCTITTRAMVNKDPRFGLTTFDTRQKPAVKAAEQWLNREVEKMYLYETEQRTVFDAIFCLGVTKVALSTPEQAAMNAWTYRAGVPFVAPIDIDDFGFDTRARSFKEASYVFHRYRVPLDAVRDDKRFGKGRFELRASTPRRYNLTGDERISNLGRGWQGDDVEFEDHVDLWEVELRRHRVVVTLMDNEGQPAPTKNGEALFEQPWIGPECGGYHFLYFAPTPGNAMGKPPISDLYGPAKSINNIARKLTLQAESQKDLLLVQSGATATGTKLANAKDGDVLDVDRPEAAKQQSLSGPNALNGQFLSALMEIFNEQAGNLRTAGGTKAQADTATQEKLLNENSSAGIQDMQEWVVKHLSSIGSALLWYAWNDPKLVMDVPYSPPGFSGMSVERQVMPWNHPDPNALKRDGPMPEVRVDPYSLRHKTPQQRVAEMDQLMTQILLPAQPVLQQQNITLDMNYYLKRRAELLDSPDLVDIVQIMDTPPVQAPPEKQGAGPAQTRREYVRHSAGGDNSAASQENDRDNLMSQMAASQRNGQMNGAPK